MNKCSCRDRVSIVVLSFCSPARSFFVVVGRRSFWIASVVHQWCVCRQCRSSENKCLFIHPPFKVWGNLRILLPMVLMSWYSYYPRLQYSNVLLASELSLSLLDPCFLLAPCESTFHITCFCLFGVLKFSFLCRLHMGLELMTWAHTRVPCLTEWSTHVPYITSVIEYFLWSVLVLFRKSTHFPCDTIWIIVKIPFSLCF